MHPTIELRSIIKWVSLTCLVVIVIGYVIFQARFLLIGPVVALTKDTAYVYNQRIVDIEGTAHNITNITLNGRPIFTDESGFFSEALVLENGYTIMTIRAQDRYGRETSITRSFVYRPASSINL